MRKNIIGFSVVLTLFGSIFGAYAADFNFLPTSGGYGLNQGFSVNLKIDTDGSSVNAAQAKISFDPNVLEVKDISKDGSIFNFWLQEPEFSNTDGTIEFIGGTPNGVSGNSLQIFKINFTTKGIGSSNLSFPDAAITAADGSGTNILGDANGAVFVVSSGGAVPTPPPIAPGAPPVAIATPIPAPIQIIRQPIKASGLPSIPTVEVSLYSDQDKWYNLVSNFTASWFLPDDISDLATALNQNPNYVVPEKSEGLFNSKTFPAISDDGVYYLHLRFKNNIGWGPTVHYKIAIDTQPPLPFKINVKTGLSSDDPSPFLVFNTGDALSGVDFDIIKINSEEPIIHLKPEYKLTPHGPGLYMISVEVIDKAGNSVEDRVEVEILPIDSPEITFITKTVLRGTDDRLVVRGVAVPDGGVIVTVEDKDKFLVVQNEVKTNEDGEWEFSFGQELRRGKYFVITQSKDSRGALSYLTDPLVVEFKDKPIIVLFGLEITLRNLLMVLVIAVIAGAVYYWRKVLVHITRAHRQTIIITRDIKNAFNIAREALDRFNDVSNKPEAPKEEKTAEYNKVKESLEKVEKYVNKDIEKLE